MLYESRVINELVIRYNFSMVTSPFGAEDTRVQLYHLSL